MDGQKDVKIDDRASEVSHPIVGNPDLKQKAYRLEVWKTGFSLLTPILLVVLGFLVNNTLQERAEALRTKEQILIEKQETYAELGKNLNAIFVYINDIGDYGSYSPDDIIKQKRQADVIFHAYLPYWSVNTQIKYDDFMNAAFEMCSGYGSPAKIKTEYDQKASARRQMGKDWQDDWAQYFSNYRDPETFTKYYSLVSSILADTVNTNVRTIEKTDARYCR